MRNCALKAALVLLLLIPSGYLAWMSRDMPQLGSLWDDGVYWVSAKSLADGSGYRIPSLPDRPCQTKYPPLFPLALSAVWRINPRFPENLPLAAMLAWLMLPAFLFAAWFHYRQLGLGRKRSWLMVAFLALNPTIILLSLNVLTELMFTCLLLFSLNLADRAGQPASRRWLAVAAGALGGAAYLTRSAAGPLLLTAPICLLLRKRRVPALLFFLAMAPAVIGWNWWVRSHQAPGTDIMTLYYTNYLGYHLHNFSFETLPLMFWRNLSGVLSGVGGLFIVNVEGSLPVRALSLLLAIFSIGGMLRLTWRAGATQHFAFAASLLAALALWHFPPDERYVMPLFPLLLAGLVSVAGPLLAAAKQSLRCSGAGQRVSAALVVLAAAAIALSGLWLNGSALVTYFPRQIKRERVESGERRQAHQWISQNLAGRCGFLAHYDAVLYLDTGCPATRLVVPTRLYYSRDRAALTDYVAALGSFMRASGLKYVLLRPADFYAAELPGHGVPLVTQVLNRGGEFQLLHEAPKFAVYSLAVEKHAGRKSVW